MKNKFKVGGYARVIDPFASTKLKKAKEHNIAVFIEHIDSEGLYYHFWHDDCRYNGYGVFKRFEPINTLDEESIEL